jgi:hypothetical protein
LTEIELLAGVISSNKEESPDICREQHESRYHPFKQSCFPMFKVSSDAKECSTWIISTGFVPSKPWDESLDDPSV